MNGWLAAADLCHGKAFLLTSIKLYLKASGPVSLIDHRPAGWKLLHCLYTRLSTVFTLMKSIGNKTRWLHKHPSAHTRPLRYISLCWFTRDVMDFWGSLALHIMASYPFFFFFGKKWCLLFYNSICSKMTSDHWVFWWLSLSVCRINKSQNSFSTEICSIMFLSWLFCTIIYI